MLSLNSDFMALNDVSVPLSSYQALIAERVGSYETMDLFRHTTELSTHVRDFSNPRWGNYNT